MKIGPIRTQRNAQHIPSRSLHYWDCTQKRCVFVGYNQRTVRLVGYMSSSQFGFGRRGHGRTAFHTHLHMELYPRRGGEVVYYVRVFRCHLSMVRYRDFRTQIRQRTHRRGFSL
jgi:hypothetical protein